MCENAYLSIKNPKASRALKQALDPGRILLASLRRQLWAAEAGAPPLTKSWIRTCLFNVKFHQIILKPFFSSDTKICLPILR